MARETSTGQKKKKSTSTLSPRILMERPSTNVPNTDPPTPIASPHTKLPQSTTTRHLTLNTNQLITNVRHLTSSTYLRMNTLNISHQLITVRSMVTILLTTVSILLLIIALPRPRATDRNLSIARNIRSLPTPRKLNTKHQRKLTYPRNPPTRQSQLITDRLQPTPKKRNTKHQRRLLTKPMLLSTLTQSQLPTPLLAIIE
jgi:hypothetical protein